MAQVHVIAGPAGSGKTERLLTRYRRALVAGPPGTTLWLAPTARGVVDIRRRLLNSDLGGCFQPGCRTFSQFAQAVLEASPARVRRLGDLAKRQLLRRLIDAAHEGGRLRYFGAIAQTEGLVDLLAGFIRELKRLEIWPDDFRQACRARGLTDKDRELADLYDQYQELLTRHQLYDAEGRFWSARALLRDGQTRPFDQVRLVVIDGFTDFTRTQHEILEILATRAEEIYLSLPLEQASGKGSPHPGPLLGGKGEVDGGERDELFSKTRRTLTELQRNHPTLTVEWLPRRKSTMVALDHVERELFGNPRRSRSAPDATGIEILAAAGQLGEIELIGEQIKRLLVGGEGAGGTGVAPVRREGEASAEPLGATGSASATPGATAGLSSSAVSPSDIAVVFRSLRDVAPLVREVFGQLGIPYALESGRPLAEAPGLAALVGLLRLSVEDWPFRQLLATLTNNYFQPGWREWKADAVAAAERLIRQLQIPRGAADLLERLERWANAVDAPGESAEQTKQDDARSERRRRMLRRRALARRALPLLTKLRETLSLPKRCTPREWVTVLENLAEQTGLLPTIDSAPSPPGKKSYDRAAWEQLLESLAESEQLAAWLEEPPPQWTATDLLEEIQEVLRVSVLPGDSDEGGRVRVLSAPTARTLRTAYLFAAGLSERAFPPPDREDSLYGEREVRSLNQNGLRLSIRDERSAEEMLLFYEVITRATRRLWLSYPALDDKAQPLLPSPYLVEVERACGAGAIRRTTVPDLSPLPRGDDPLSPTAFRVQAVADVLQGEPQLLAGLIQNQPVADNVVAGLLLTDERRQGEGFGAFEGMLTSDAVRTKLAARFGPLCCWSTSQLEQYASCPHKFYLHRVLNLEPLEELALEINYMSRGGLLHDALATLHRRLHEDTGGGRRSPSAMKADDFQQAYEQAVRDCVAQLRSEGLVEDALREVDRRLITEMGQRYHSQHREYEQAWRDFDEPLTPTYFEVSFGPRRGDEPVDGISTEAPFELQLGAEKIQLAGRIDRIDVGRIAGQVVFNLLDYKSGAAAKFDRSAIEAGRALQLPLYTLAVQQMLLASQHALPLQVGYWHVKHNGFSKDALKPYELSGGELQPTPDWSALVDTVLARVAALVGGIRDAQFPMHSADDKCTSRCSYRTVCRVHQVRALGKNWEPPAAPQEPPA